MHGRLSHIAKSESPVMEAWLVSWAMLHLQQPQYYVLHSSAMCRGLPSRWQLKSHHCEQAIKVGVRIPVLFASYEGERFPNHVDAFCPPPSCC